MPQFLSMSTEALIVPPMSADLSSLPAWTLIYELNHLEDVISKASNRKREIEDVMNMMNPSYSASTYATTTPDDVEHAHSTIT